MGIEQEGSRSSGETSGVLTGAKLAEQLEAARETGGPADKGPEFVEPGQGYEAASKAAAEAARAKIAENGAETTGRQPMGVDASGYGLRQEYTPTRLTADQGLAQENEFRAKQGLDPIKPVGVQEWSPAEQPQGFGAKLKKFANRLMGREAKN